MKKKIGDLKIREAVELIRDCEETSVITCLVDCKFFDEEKNECMLKSLDTYAFSKIDLEQEIEVGK